MAEKEFVVFTIDEIVDRKTDFVKLKAQGYTLNYKYNAQYSPANFASKFQTGDHLSAPIAKVTNSHGGTSRYINDPISRRTEHMDAPGGRGLERLQEEVRLRPRHIAAPDRSQLLHELLRPPRAGHRGRRA